LCHLIRITLFITYLLISTDILSNKIVSWSIATLTAHFNSQEKLIAHELFEWIIQKLYGESCNYVYAAFNISENIVNNAPLSGDLHVPFSFIKPHCMIEYWIFCQTILNIDFDQIVKCQEYIVSNVFQTHKCKTQTYTDTLSFIQTVFLEPRQIVHLLSVNKNQMNAHAQTHSNWLNTNETVSLQTLRYLFLSITGSQHWHLAIVLIYL